MVLKNCKEFNRIATTVNNYMCMENCTADKQKVFHLSPTFLALHSPLFTLLPPSLSSLLYSPLHIVLTFSTLCFPAARAFPLGLLLKAFPESVSQCFVVVVAMKGLAWEGSG